MAGQKFLNIPNWITLGRLMAMPVLFVFMLFLNDGSHHIKINKTISFVSAMIFAVAMATDMLDGYLARRLKLTSTFGKFIDPLADKMLFLVAMIMMIPLGRMPAWLVAIFFIREVTVTALRGVAVDEGIVISASHWGKYKSAFISTATVGLLLHYPFFGIEWRYIAWVLLIPATIFSIGSGLHYTIGFFRAVAKKDVQGDCPRS